MSRLVERNLFIIGSESEFSDLLGDKFERSAHGFFKYNLIFGNWDDFYLFLEEQVIDMLFVDFYTGHDKKVFENHVENLLRIKKSNTYARIPVVSVCEKREQLDQIQYIRFAGINYFHIIGDDFNLFFGNILYIGFEDESYFLKLARAIKLEVKMDLVHECPILELNKFQVIVGSDLSFGEELTAKIPAGFSAKNLNFEISDIKSQCIPFPYLSCYELDLIAEGSGWDSNNSWEEDEDEEQSSEGDISGTLAPEDFEHWVNNLIEDQVCHQEEEVLLYYYSQKPSWLFRDLRGENKATVNLCHFKSFVESEIMAYDVPDFIIFDCVSEEDVDRSDTLLTYYSNNKKQPIIILKNHPSKTAALKKMYEYDSVLVYSDEINAKTLEQMISMVKTNKHSEKDFYKVDYFKESLSMDLPIEVKVTSLSENEITFMTEQEIPFFTNMVISNGEFNANVIIVPSYLNLSPNIHGFHYLALFNKCTEHTRQDLRGIVKRFVDKQPPQWGGVTLFNHGEGDDTEDQPTEIKYDKTKDDLERTNPPADKPKMKSKVRQLIKGAKTKL